MSVKHALLALLATEPSSTYQLRKRFEVSTAQSWPLNIGQASTTLQRLERDGLATRDSQEQPWHLTAAGEAELAEWWQRPVIAEQRGRNELVVKLMLAAQSPSINVDDLIHVQRLATQRDLHDLTKLRRDVARDDLVGGLVLDHHIYVAEAELRWLDDVEGTLDRVVVPGASAGVATGTAAAPTLAAGTTGSVTASHTGSAQ